MDLRTADGVVVAKIIDGEAVKRVLESKHKLRRPEGWAFDKTIIRQAKEGGASAIRIEAGDTGKSYSVSMSEFDKHAFPLNRGFGPQMVLVIKYWQPEMENRYCYEKAKQLSLFGGLNG